MRCLARGSRISQYFFRAIGCCGSKENVSPLSHGAAGIFLCLSLAGKKGKKKKSDRVLGLPIRIPGLGVRPPTKCLCPRWTARDCPVRPSIDVGFTARGWPISALGARPPIPAREPRGAGPSPSLAPRLNRRPLSCSCPRKHKRRDQTRGQRDNPKADVLRVVRDET